MSARGLRDRAREGTVHFMGIGGAGMCALAELFHRSGYRVTGCDLRRDLSARSLEALGIPVAAGHSPDHLEGVSAVVVSSAISPSNPEVRAAHERGIPVVKRAEALGQWVNPGTVVAVAGTHGKTTTTALATEILAAAGRDPTGVVGGRVAGWKGNLRYGRGDLYVVEADEYDRSFHHITPRTALVTNLEADHLDTYGNLAGLRDAFRTFVDAVPSDGTVCVCADDPGASKLLAGIGARTCTYGFRAGAQLQATRVRTGPGGARARIFEDGRDRGELSIRLPGAHNLLNALGAAAAARRMGVAWSDIRRSLAGFRGVRRRFERLGRERGVTVVDDYAHHPTEIAAAIAAARGSFPGARLVAVFQPHLFSRTRDFASQLGAALAAGDRIWVSDIYPAREAPIPGITGELVCDAVTAAQGGDGRYHPDLTTLPAALADTLRAGDVCLTLGAGSIESTGPALLRRLGGHDA
ncbi:MAG: UDP-N-acetylmuramate--L-alanine ligase [Gammaproteobacteria bacterium]|nr:UDP-N-acetylmuramate--L-alanine ligase [Gammaproteobacteria bacterium]MYC52374.1 UDP-N-acetylmuramate--L-alanine ligase [Gammaproteobacteria bacterium]